VRKPPKDHVDVGRSTTYGNPVRIGHVCQYCNRLHETAGDTLPCFRKYAEGRMGWDERFLQAVRDLAGKKLWCPGCGVNSPTCHARVLVELSKK